MRVPYLFTGSGPPVKRLGSGLGPPQEAAFGVALAGSPDPDHVTGAQRFSAVRGQRN